MDADDDCAVSLADGLRARATATRVDVRSFVVLPVREFEAWFLAGAVGLAGKYGLPHDLAPPGRPETVRGAKEWFTRQMPSGQSYQPSAHQAGFAQHFDLEAAREASGSFRKLCRDLQRVLKA